MNRTSYYVPEMEDISLGYKLEILIDGVWTPRIYSISDSIQGLKDEGVWVDDKVRVKYLNNEDITSILKHREDGDEDEALFKLSRVDDNNAYYKAELVLEEYFILKHNFDTHKITIALDIKGDVKILVTDVICKCLHRFLIYLKEHNIY